MLRLRIPIALIVSGLAFPALGKTTNISLAIPSSVPIVSVKYQSLLARQFNAEIESSIARVRALHAEAFVRARNAEINASVARVAAQRLKAFEQARNAEINASIARVAFRHARNGEINVSIARVQAQRLKAFEQAHNAEINASIARVQARRALLETGTVSMSEPGKAQSDDKANFDVRRIQTCSAVAVLLNQVTFASSSAKIDESSKPTLDELATLSKYCPGAHIEIHGHTDSSGSEKANLRISKQRAEAVAYHLIAAGVEARRLKTIAHGSADPVAPNTTAENRALNRRIEFKIKSPSSEATAAIALPDLAELLDSNDKLWFGRHRP